MKKLSFLFLCMMVLASCSQSDVTKESTNDSKSVENVIMARRSIRQYTKQTISRDTLDQIIKCGINAPNGQNRQAYEIRVVNNPQLLKEISDAVLKDNKDMSLKPGTDNIFFGASTVVFIGNDMSYDMSQIDCGLLGENIMLSAWEKGIGSCCMAFPIRLMKESESCAPLVQKLGFSAGYNLLYCIAMGYPNENPDAKPRKEDMIKYVE
jgi:nitroreductase